MPHGHHGKILHVDLTKGLLEIEEPDETFYRHYMGGSALGTYYLLKNTPAGADPLGPENTLVLSLSVLTGAPVSGSSVLSRAVMISLRSSSYSAPGSTMPCGSLPRRLIQILPRRSSEKALVCDQSTPANNSWRLNRLRQRSGHTRRNRFRYW